LTGLPVTQHLYLAHYTAPSGDNPPGCVHAAQHPQTRLHPGWKNRLSKETGTGEYLVERQPLSGEGEDGISDSELCFPTLRSDPESSRTKEYICLWYAWIGRHTFFFVTTNSNLGLTRAERKGHFHLESSYTSQYLLQVCHFLNNFRSLQTYILMLQFITEMLHPNFRTVLD